MNANQSPPEIETDSQVEPGSGPGVGALLHASRLRCGEDLRDVAQILRIRYVHLEAIEAGRFEDLPGPAYAVGFVRAYAKHLGLDADEVVKRFRAETTNIGETPELSFPVPVPEGGIPGGAVLFVGVVVAVLAYGGWYVSSAKEGFFTELISPLPDRLAALLTPGDSSTPAPDTAKEDGKGKAGNASSPAPTTAAAPPGETPSSPEKPDQGGQDQMSDEPASSPPAQSETSAVDTSSATGPASEAGPPDAPESGTTETASTDAVPAEEARDAEEGAGASTPGGGGQARPDEEKAAEIVAENGATGDSADAGGDRAGPAAAPMGDSQTSGVDRESAGGGAPQPVASGDAAGAGEPSQPARTADGGGDTAPSPSTPAADTSVAGEGGSASATVEAPAARDDGAPAGTPAAIDAGGSAPAVRDGAEPPQEVAAVPPANDASAGTTRTGRVFGTGNADSRILVRAKMNSWIQVRDDDGNRLLLTRLLRTGDTYRVPNRPGLKLLTGNAGALEILVDGEAVPSIGPLGAVRRGVALDIERLRQGTAIIE